MRLPEFLAKGTFLCPRQALDRINTASLKVPLKSLPSSARERNIAQPVGDPPVPVLWINRILASLLASPFTITYQLWSAGSTYVLAPCHIGFVSWLVSMAELQACMQDIEDDRYPSIEGLSMSF